MTTDEAIKATLKLLNKQKAEIEKELLANSHECDCEFCDIEDLPDEDKKAELLSELDQIEIDIARYSNLKLREDV